MAKKGNVYNQVQYDKLKNEVNTVINFIERLDVENITDDIEWSISQTTGKITPMIVATIEKKIKITVETIKECGQILITIHEKEGLTEYLKSRIMLIKNCLESIQAYYEARPVDAISDRIVEYTSGTRKNGSSIEVKFVAADKYTQIQHRTTLTRKVLEVLPVLGQLEKFVAEVQIKGDSEYPESMMYDDEDERPNEDE